MSIGGKPLGRGMHAFHFGTASPLTASRPTSALVSRKVIHYSTQSVLARRVLDTPTARFLDDMGDDEFWSPHILPLP